MPLTRIETENFTVFEDITIPFSKGLNVLVGENGMGKTHIMKLAYAACQASKHDVSFSQKTTMLFRPDQSSIGRLVNRNKNRKNTAKVLVDRGKMGKTDVRSYQRIYSSKRDSVQCLEFGCSSQNGECRI